MGKNLDNHGQPLVRRYASARVSDRSVNELIGLCRGVLADGIVSLEEAQFMMQWLDDNRHISSEWPANILTERIREMLEDHILDADEQGELLELLHQATGGGLAPTAGHASGSTLLPLCTPAPDVVFSGRLFCLTGKFAIGTRKQCEEEVVGRGGRAKSQPTRETDYLVIGQIGSRDWIHSTHGRKIEKAVRFRENGVPIRIISEEHWADSLAS